MKPHKNGANPRASSIFKKAYDYWMLFAELLGAVVISTALTLIFLFIIPFFYYLFLRKQDILVKDTNKQSFWKTPKPVSFDLKRNYKLF